MKPLLMIPGPIEVTDEVVAASAVSPPSHVSADFIEMHGSALERMRAVWLAGPEAQPYVVPGSGTLAMEMAAQNLVAPGERALVVDTGYFGDRMTEMLRRRGAEVTELVAEVGAAPPLEEVAAALGRADYKALFATHVDTSTGVRVAARELAGVARDAGVLSVFDGVCATGGERFAMAEWGADVYLTASQKAIGLPAGLALMVVSKRAQAARSALSTPPPYALDWEAWRPIMASYEARKPSYFSTPATTLVAALDVSLGQLLAGGIEARFALHERAAEGMRAAWATLGLSPLCLPELAANTLSALRYPAGVDAALVAAIAAEGVIVAGGLHPEVKGEYFRVGHMGAVTERPEALRRTVLAVGKALVGCGHSCDPDAATAAAEAVWQR